MIDAAKYQLKPEAENDLKDIWRFGDRQWGSTQADKYIAKLSATIERIAAMPNIGMLCDDIREGYRRYPFGKHVIYYEITANSILVVRILNQRMRAKSYL